MRYFILTLTVMFFFAFAVQANTKDSLLNVMDLSSAEQLHIKIYRDLADISYETPEESVYLMKMYEKAKSVNDKQNMKDALGGFIYTKIKSGQIDSVHYYLDMLKKTDSEENVKDWLTYLKLRLFDYEILNSKRTTTLTDTIIYEQHDIYEKLERSYIIGSALLAQEKAKEALPYLNTALKYAKAFPLDISFKYQRLISSFLSSAYFKIGDKKRSVNIVENMIKLREEHYDKYYRNSRPFYNIRPFYIEDYSFILTNIEVLSHDTANLYLEHIMALTKNTTNLVDKYYRFLSMYSYYMHRKESAKALVASDSLIVLAEIFAPYNLSGLYESSALVYEQTGDYKHALERTRRAYEIKDSLMLELTNNQINELQVKYDVDMIKFKNIELENERKMILLLFLGVLLLVAIVIVFFLFNNLRREKRMKNHLEELNIKVGESEKMKKDFLSSMCREIRTPLNAIVGFTDLLEDKSIDSATREKFSETIKINVFYLTSLIDTLLEVANLDNMHDDIPCEGVSLNAICTQAMNLIIDSSKEDIEYIADLPKEDLIINTNSKYLGIVVRQLLDNANKFTEKGFVKLCYTIDSVNNNLILTVIDTGCGVSLDKQNIIFDRFIKLNDFSQGSGLGLYMSRLIMRRLKGDLQIDSTYTTGARFVLIHPLSL